MNARLQQLMALLRLGACLAVLLWSWQSGQSMAEGLGWLLLVGWGWALLMLPRFLVPHLLAPERWLPALQAWWTEVWVCERVFSWHQPFASQSQSDHLPEACGKPGVLLLHGFSCNRGLWNPWMRLLRARGNPFIALTLEPAYGSIDAYADSIEAALQALERASPGRPPLIVGHSMGGLAARAWLRRYGRVGRVQAVVTLGTPHAGTALAHLSHTTNGRQMRRDSPWLTGLAAQETPALYQQFDCVYSREDQIVFPAETAVLPGSRVSLLPHLGHLGLAFAPQSYALVLQRLDEAEGLGAGG